MEVSLRLECAAQFTMGNLPTYRRLADAVAGKKPGDDVFAFSFQKNLWDPSITPIFICLKSSNYAQFWLNHYDETCKFLRVNGNYVEHVMGCDDLSPLKYLTLQMHYSCPSACRFFMDIESKAMCRTCVDFMDPFVEELYRVLVPNYAYMAFIHVFEANHWKQCTENPEPMVPQYKLKKASYHVHVIMYGSGGEELFLPSIKSMRFICAQVICQMYDKKSFQFHPSPTDPYLWREIESKVTETNFLEHNRVIDSVKDRLNASIIDRKVWVDGSRLFRIPGAFKMEGGSGIHRPLKKCSVYNGQWEYGTKMTSTQLLQFLIAPSILPTGAVVLDKGLPKNTVIITPPNKQEDRPKKPQGNNYKAVIKLVLGVTPLDYDLIVKSNTHVTDVQFSTAKVCKIREKMTTQSPHHISNRCQYNFIFSRQGVNVYCKCHDLECCQLYDGNLEVVVDDETALKIGAIVSDFVWQ